MSDNRDVAKQILLEAGNTILKDRPGVHGSAENSFELIGDLWSVYARHIVRVRGVLQFKPEDVAEMMSMLKKARKIYGASSNVDNDVDDIGYSALAGMLRLPDPAKSTEEEIEEGIRKEADKPDIPIAKPMKIDTRGVAERSKKEYAPFGYRSDGQPLTEEEYKSGATSYPTSAGEKVDA